jgi:hypothetical protein
MARVCKAPSDWVLDSSIIYASGTFRQLNQLRINFSLISTSVTVKSSGSPRIDGSMAASLLSATAFGAFSLFCDVGEWDW